MSSSETLPPARERNRQGIRAYGENTSGEATDALIDRAQFTVTGTLAAKSPDAVHRFAEAIGSGEAVRLFGPVRPQGRRWTAKSNDTTTISHAELTIWDLPERGGFKLTVAVNPIRTLGHILDSYTFGDIEGLTPYEFFAKRPEPRAAAITLDGNDNMVADYLAFSGTLPATYVQRVATYLDLFERALVQRLLVELCPPDRGYTLRTDGDAWLAESDDLTVRLEWGALTVSQCEVCWERRDEQTLARVHALADDMLLSARSVEVPIFTRPSRKRPISVERELGAIAVRIPLPGDVTVVVYAKSRDRLRFEVRYSKNLPDMVRSKMQSSGRTLVQWFNAIREHAASRLRWSDLHQRLQPQHVLTVDALTELTLAVADAATGKRKPKRNAIIRELLLHGAITATSSDGEAPFGILDRLARRGVLEHVPLLSRDAKIGRRFRLSARYTGLATALQHAS